MSSFARGSVSQPIFQCLGGIALGERPGYVELAATQGVKVRFCE